MDEEKQKGLKTRFTGKAFTIIHCVGAKESFDSAIASVPSGRRKSFTRAMILQIQRLADEGRLSAENFPQEGALPKKIGQQNTKYFRALKRKPIRAYCWLSETKLNTYYISHYVYKDQNKLSAKDTTKVGHNWRRIEEKGNER